MPHTAKELETTGCNHVVQLLLTHAFAWLGQAVTTVDDAVQAHRILHQHLLQTSCRYPTLHL